MPWVDEVIRHDNFLNELFYKVFRRFEDVRGKKWWIDFDEEREKIDVYKVAFENGFLDENYTLPKENRTGQVSITRHMIMKRWDGQLLSFCQSTGSVKVGSKDIPKDEEGLKYWIYKFYTENLDYTNVYAYTLEDYEPFERLTVGVKEGGQEQGVSLPKPFFILTDDEGYGVLRASLDIEFHGEDAYFPHMMQSPIVVMKLKGDTGDLVSSIGKLNFRTNTNWWGDSLIQLRGVFDETSSFFTLKVDSAPMWEDNMVTIVPFFFGNLITKGDYAKNETPIALMGGSQVDKYFDFDSIEESTEILQPITRNYVSHPSNGVDSIMIKKTKYGARYQAHYLSWNVPPNEMPPTREEIRLFKDKIEGDIIPGHTSHRIGVDLKETDEWMPVHDYAEDIEEAKYVLLGGLELCRVVDKDPVGKRLKLKRSCEPARFSKDALVVFYRNIDTSIRKYPRAWNYLRKCYYDYGFTTSRYSDKVHTSRATVVHPEDGVAGYIPNILVLPALNIVEGDKLRFRYYCEDCSQEPYNPPAPEGEVADWIPAEPSPIDPTDPNPTDPNDPTDPNPGDEGDDTTPTDPPNDGDFSYMCDGTLDKTDVDATYWNISPSVQGYITQQIGRELDADFWKGRNDFLEMFGVSSDADGQYDFTSSMVNTSDDFYYFLWQAIEDVKAGDLSNNSDWKTFDTWASQDLSCLTDLQRASLWLSTKLERPVTFHPSASGYLEGDTLDVMLPMLRKVPNEVYNWMDFNNVYVESDSSQGIVGAFVKDFSLYPESGERVNAIPEFRSMVSFEPQALNYPYSALKAHKPFDYVKPNKGFGSPVVGGEYSDYYVGNIDQSNFTPYVASEVAIHEMGHALSNYGEDILGTRLDDMTDWLNISWGTDSNGEWDGQEAKKSSPGTTLDNGKLAPVSDYGCFHPAEDFAEAFTMYVINRKFLKDNFKEKHDFIQDKLQAMGLDPNL